MNGRMKRHHGLEVSGQRVGERKIDKITLVLLVISAFSMMMALKGEAALRRRTNLVEQVETLYPFVEESVEQSKPKLILHVGPPKTSTTTLQAILTGYRDTLKMDNYLYVGRIYDSEGVYQRYEEEAFFDLSNPKCVVGHGLKEVFEEHKNDKMHDWTHDEEAPACWKDFLVELARVRRSNMNLIISDEKLCLRGYNDGLFHFELLKETFRDWDVRVLVTYRRFFAWLPSHKNHLDNYRLKKGSFSEWNGQQLDDFFPVLQESLHDESKLRYPYVDTIVNEYSKYFPVQVMNMHDTEYPTLATQFVCKYLPDAAHACEQSRRNKDSDSGLELNKAKSSYYDKLAMAAFSKGLVSPAAGRRAEIRDLIQQEHETRLGLKPSDFPLKCPKNSALEPILEKSLQYEEQFFPEFHHSEIGKKRHRAEFWEMVKKKRFCSIDTEQTLENEAWVKFFNKLNREGRRRLRALKNQFRTRNERDSYYDNN